MTGRRKDSADLPTSAPRAGTLDNLVLACAPDGRIGDWILEGRRGEGGYAVVFRAHHAETGVPAALKLLYEHLGDKPRIRFQREAEAIRRLRHPNIVRLLDAGETADGRAFLAMEWLDGRTLRDELIAGGPLTLAETIEILRELCGALDAAHAAGLVHRDVKSSNVMRLASGQVKLLDFGIAKTMVEDVRGGLTTNSILGTPTAMAPEQILGQAVDPRTDVYALGVLLHELMTGRLPFEAETAIEMEAMHLSTPPPPISALVPVPRGVDDVLARCLAKRREDRFVSVLEFLEALERAARDMSAPAEARRLELGVHVAVSLRGGEPTDDRLDAQEDALDAAARLLDAAGLRLAFRAGNSLLVLAPLPRAGAPAAVAREQAVHAALDAHAAAATAAAAGTDLDISITVHAATVARAPEGDRFTGGELLDVVAWAAPPDAGGVFATEAALAGVTDEFDLSAAPAPAPACRQVLAARRRR